MEQQFQKRATFQEDNFNRYIVLTVFSFQRKEKGVGKWCILGILKDMQTQITKNYQLTAVRMAISKNASKK